MSETDQRHSKYNTPVVKHRTAYHTLVPEVKFVNELVCLVQCFEPVSLFVYFLPFYCISRLLVFVSPWCLLHFILDV